MALFLEPFKAAAAEGAVVELKLPLLAGKVPVLQKYAHKKELGELLGRNCRAATVNACRR
jgi:hypothetical protein